MDCHHFDRLLGALLDGACTPDEWQLAETHLAACARCRRLHEALSGRVDTLDEAGHAALTASIVARTSGGTCAAAHDRLCDFVDGALAGFDRTLVEGHLARCADCTALAGALARSERVLPSFAEIAPAAWFTSRVLAATSRRQSQPALGRRVAAWLARAAARPRFSVEVAYVCTLVLMVLLSDPVKAVRATTERGVSYLQPRAEVVVLQVSGRLADIRRLTAEAAGAVVSTARRSDSSPAAWDAGVGAVRRWFTENLGAPVRAIFERMFRWMRAAFDTFERLFLGSEPGTQPPGVPDSGAPLDTEPSGSAVRLT